MHSRYKEGIVKTEMLGIKHVLVVDTEESGENVPGQGGVIGREE